MPFNGSGTFTIVNTFVPNTTILSAAVNQNFSDIATGLSDCLTRDGQAGMSAAFKAISGSVSAPGISFNSDATAGLFLSSTGIVGLVAKSLGLLVNSSILQVATATVQAGGTGYAVGDVIQGGGGTVVGGTSVLLTVATLSGSAVATATVSYPASYTVTPSNPVSQSFTDGSGTGATFNLTYTTQFTRSALTDEAGGTLWQRLGASSFSAGLMPSANAYGWLSALATIGSGLSLNRTTNPPTLTTTTNPTFIPNYLSGLTLSMSGSSGTFGIATGAANDTTNVSLMKLASAYTKTTASWALGTGNGGLDAGAIAINTWYHVHLIQRVDTNVVDVLFSLSATSPTLPASYTLFRRIGSMKTNASSQWILYHQLGNEFLWDVAVNDITSSTLGTTPVLFSMNSTPVGVQCNILIRGYTSNASGNVGLLINSPDESAVAYDSPSGNKTVQAPLTGVSAGAVFTLSVRTSTASQIRGVATAASTVLVVATYGFIDQRGQL